MKAQKCFLNEYTFIVLAAAEVGKGQCLLSHQSGLNWRKMMFLHKISENLALQKDLHLIWSGSCPSKPLSLGLVTVWSLRSIFSRTEGSSCSLYLNLARSQTSSPSSFLFFSSLSFYLLVAFLAELNPRGSSPSSASSVNCADVRGQICPVPLPERGLHSRQLSDLSDPNSSDCIQLKKKSVCKIHQTQDLLLRKQMFQGV